MPCWLSFMVLCLHYPCPHTHTLGGHISTHVISHRFTPGLQIAVGFDGTAVQSHGRLSRGLLKEGRRRGEEEERKGELAKLSRSGLTYFKHLRSSCDILDWVLTRVRNGRSDAILFYSRKWSSRADRLV